MRTEGSDSAETGKIEGLLRLLTVEERKEAEKNYILKNSSSSGTEEPLGAVHWRKGLDIYGRISNPHKSPIMYYY